MRRDPELSLMLQAARLYYEDNKTQDEVASTLGISRSKVSRLLTQARERGIVQITVVDPDSTHAQLEQALIETFGLTDVVVAAGIMQSGELQRKRIGQAAARYVETILEEGDRVGIGSGRTLYAMASSLLSRERQIEVGVVPLIGGLDRVPACFQANELAKMVAEAMGGTWQFLYAPAILDSAEARQSLLSSHHVQEVINAWDTLTVALVGIGNVLSRTGVPTLFTNFLNEDAQMRLRDQGAVGGICALYYDAAGSPCPELSDRVVGIGLGQLRRIRRLIAIAGGPDKTEAILAALRGRYVNTLITDEATAQAILDLVCEEGANQE